MKVRRKEINIYWASTNFFFYFKNWSIIALHCRVSFCYMTKWISYVYTYIPSLLSLPPNPSRPFRSSWSAELSSLCHTVASHWLSNLHMVVWVGEIPWRWKCQPAQVLLPGESHVQRSLVGYSPWDRKRDGHDLTTEQQRRLSVYISVLLSIHPPASLLCPQVFSLCLCLSIHYWWFMLSHWIVMTLEVNIMPVFGSVGGKEAVVEGHSAWLMWLG